MKEIQAWLECSNYNTSVNLYAHLDTNSVSNLKKLIPNVFSIKKEVVSS